MKNNYLVRKATSEDAPAIAKIHVETWQSVYRGQMPDSLLDNLSIQKLTIFKKKVLAN